MTRPSLVFVWIAALAGPSLAQPVPRAPSPDGSIATEVVRFDEPVSISRLPEELARRGFEDMALLLGGRAPQVDELAGGVAPELDLPNRAAIAPDGTRAVTSFYLSGNVGIQDLSTYAWVATVAVGAQPVDVDVTPSGSHALVVCQGSNSVVGVNLATSAVDYTVPATTPSRPSTPPTAATST